MQNNYKGCIIFAYNTDNVNYFSQAVVAADLVVQHLDLPVSIITNEHKECNHNIIVTELPPPNFRFKKVWHNRSRTSAFDITPYDKTLVIDSDYYIQTNTLRYHFDSAAPFLIAQEIYEPHSGCKVVYKLGKTHIPVMWATIMMFDKSDISHGIFECAKHVEQHYRYYSTYYKFNHHPIRNDYVFSIACHLMSGYGRKSFALKNYPLVNCDNQITYDSYDGNKLIYKYMRDKMYGNRLQNIDLHLMNKDQL